jgi:hypothetical protein
MLTFLFIYHIINIVIYLQGEVQVLTGGKAREPSNRLTWIVSKADSIVWMKEDVVDLVYFCTPKSLTSGYFYIPEAIKGGIVCV